MPETFFIAYCVCLVLLVGALAVDIWTNGDHTGPLKLARLSLWAGGVFVVCWLVAMLVEGASV